MATFEDLDKEKIAELERLLRGKANTLGQDGKASNEAFSRADKVAHADVMRQSPSTVGGLVPPNYDDLPTPGTIGTRYEEIRLHSYLPSGLDGPNSIQTFMTVSLPPNSHNFSDVEAVRLKPLISPRYSQGKSNATHSDPQLRGFELVLYPAKSNGGLGNVLIADTNKPISPVADPGAGPPSDLAPGLGTSGSWYVDYDNGIVRFSRPPLNGSNGVMNPNNVYGDIEGVEVDDAYGAITMFATFYHYTGEFGTTANLSFLTVGDGYVSEGVFTGQNHNTVLSAIASLPTNGGTVFIKEGTYDFVEPVIVPKNVNIVGLGGVKIIRPPTTPAFVIYDGYNIIEGLEIQHRRETPVSSEGAIELRAAGLNHIIKEVKIRNNVIYCDADAYGIAFSPEFNCTYNGLHIYNNLFELVGDDAHGISERPAGGLAIIKDSIIENNNFQQSEVSTFTYALNFFQHSLRNIDGLTIANNMMSGSKVIFRVSGSNDILKFTYANNSSDDVTIWSDRLDNSIISNNLISNNTDFDIHANTIDTCIISDNVIDGNMNITTSTVSSTNINNLTVSGNNITGTLFIQEPGDLFNTLISSNTIADLYVPALNTSSILSNHILGSLGIATSSPNVQAMFVSSVSSNRTVSIDIGNSANANSFSLVEDSVISSNYTNNITLYGMIESSSVTGNTVLVNMNLKNVGDSFNGCTITGNFVSGMTFTSLLDSTVSSNTLNGNMTLTSSTATSSLIDGNTFNSTSFSFSGTTLSRTVVSNNSIGSSLTIGTLTNSAILNNSISSSLTIQDSMSSSNVNGNYIGSTTSLISNLTGEINGCEVNNNIFKSNVTINRAFLDSTYMDGYITGSTTFSERVTNSIISNNNITSALTLSSIVTNSVISSNIVGATFTTGVLIGTNVSNNILNGAYSFGAQLNSNLIGNRSSAANEGIRSVNSSMLYVATGNTGTLATSSDGISWTQRTSSFSSDLILGVAYNGRDLFVAVGGNGKIATSPDGITWTQRTSGFGANTVNGIAYDGKGTWVAVGNGGLVATSKDGIVWTHEISNFAGSNIQAVAHNGRDLWIIVGNLGKLATSSDAVTWTIQTSSFAADTIVGIGHDGKGLWVAVGNAGKIATSPDGINWTQQTSGFGAQNVFDVAYNGKDLWAIVGQSGKISTSPDGVTWTPQFPNSFSSDHINSIVYNGKDTWVAVANTGKIGTSTDGVHWVQQVSSFSTTDVYAISAVTGSNAGLVGIGSQYNGTGVQGFGRGNRGIGVEAFGGDGYGMGIHAVGGAAGGSGVETHGGPDGYGTYSIGGFPNGPGGYFLARGTGTGVTAASELGYGLIVQSDTSSPAKAALSILPQDATPTFEPGPGDIFIHKSSGRANLYDGTVWSHIPSIVYRTIADSNTISNTASETDFNTQYTFSAGALNHVGLTLKVRATVQLANTGTPTFDLRLYLAGTVVSIVYFSFAAVVSGDFDVEFIVRVSASNTTRASCMVSNSITNLSAFSQYSGGLPTLTGPTILKLTGDWNAADPANTATIKIMTVEVAGGSA